MFQGPSFIVAIVLVGTIGWIVNNWIRARHGYPLEDEWGGKSDRAALPDTRQIELLSRENADLKGKLVRLEDRVAVLERIATDTSVRLAEEIDSLR